MLGKDQDAEAHDRTLRVRSRRGRGRTTPESTSLAVVVRGELQHVGGVGAPDSPTLVTNSSATYPVAPPNLTFTHVESGPAGPSTLWPVARHWTSSFVLEGTTPRAVAVVDGEARSLTFVLVT